MHIFYSEISAVSGYNPLLSKDEWLLREHRRYERRLKRADFKGQKTIENFDFSFNPVNNQSQIRDLATCRFVQEKYPVLIMGPCGTGKSHVAQALGRCAVQKGYDVIYRGCKFQS